VTIIDLEKHRDSCLKCRPWSLCRDGAKILEAATQALAEIAAPMPVKKMGQA
jgi:hypothetical protein